MHNVIWRVFIATIIGLLFGFNSAAFAADREKTAAEQPQILHYNGLKRSYVIRAPGEPAHRNGQLPLVLVLHGGGGNAANAENMTGFSDKAKKEGFIVVYPEGTGRRIGKFLTWNAGHCCGYAMKNRVDDVGFISALIDKLIQDYAVDPKRIYATGMSNGGLMTHRLGIELSNRLAAIAPVVATLFGDEKKPAHPVSAIMLNGMLDESVPYQGGPPNGRFARTWDGTPTQPALAQAVFWANTNGCSNLSDKNDQGQIILWQYQCPMNQTVQLYLIKDNGHAWPGGRPGGRRGDIPSTSLNGTDVIWEFFKRHTK